MECGGKGAARHAALAQAGELRGCCEARSVSRTTDAPIQKHPGVMTDWTRFRRQCVPGFSQSGVALRFPPHSRPRSPPYPALLSSRRPPRNNRQAAMQMQESATLKAGHQPPLDGTSLS